MIRRGWLAGAGLALALAAPAVGQSAGPEVSELRFTGNASFTRAELASAIQTQESQCRNPVYRVLLLCWAGIGVQEAELDPGALEADVFRLKVYYYERGFREAEIGTDTTVVDEDRVRVTFRIREGRPVRVDSVVVEGLPESVEANRLPLGEGQPFDVVTYEATRDTLQSRLWNSGYANGQVLLGYTIRREAPHQATVRYEVYPGARARFGDIDVQGNQETSPELVRRMLMFEEGGLYRRSALLASQRNLYSLQIFTQADVQANVEASNDTVIPVTVRVAEGNMHRVRLGAGVNSVECGTVEGEWASRNFMGNGRRLTVRSEVGNLLINDCGLLVDDDFASYERLTGLVSVDFNQPWFFGPRNSVGLGLFAERRNVPDVFVRSALGGYLSVTRSLGRSTALTLAYRPELTELITEGELFFCVNFVACTFEAIDDLRAPHWLSPLTLSLTVDRTNSLFSPDAGFVARLDLEHAAGYTGSNFAYSRFLTEASYYLGESDGLVLATRIRGGVGVPHGDGNTQALGLNPQKRFFAGGANSVRGFDQFRLGPTVLGVDAVPWLVNGPSADQAGVGCTRDEVNSGTCDASGVPEERFELRPAGGEVLLEGNVEVRFPIPVRGDNLRGAVFVDAGQVWRESGDFAPAEIIATPGFGLRYRSPIGPIRLDAAFNPQGPQELTVLTTEVETCEQYGSGCHKTAGRSPRAFLRNTAEVVDLNERVTFGRGLGELRGVSDFLRRFQIHFSIGQAF